MTTSRDLRAALALAGYTPARRDVVPLVALLAEDEALAPSVRRALSKADAAAVVAAVRAALPDSAEGDAARLVPALGDAASRAPEATAALVAALDDARPRVRRAAATALGKVGGDDARAALCAYWDRATLDAAERRAAAAALGKVGGDEATRRLAAADVDDRDDPELARRRGQALIMAERDADDAPSEIALDVAPPTPIAMVARCRPGLETILAAELVDAGLAIDRLGPGLVGLILDGPLAPLLAARTLLTAGVLLDLPDRPGSPIPAHPHLLRPRPVRPHPVRPHPVRPHPVHPHPVHPHPVRPERAQRVEGREPPPLDAETIAQALAAPGVLALLTAWTRGPIRWRLDFEQGGHRRALVWAAAARARELAPALRNQPRATTWEVVVTTDQRHLEVRPHRYTDDRFTWRQADVPAASHPTVAAALARVAGARDGEHVWDPFCGSGAELCERGRLGPAQLHGTDLDERALAAARANLDAAGLAATLTRADALTHQPPPLGLVITNPPLGRRLRGDAGLLLERFAARVPSLLAPGGRLVWITPAPDRTGPVLRHGKLALRFARDVDLGGYEVRLERWDR